MGVERTINNPAFTTAAYFTPPGMVIGAMEGATNLIKDDVNNNLGWHSLLDAAAIAPGLSFASKPLTKSFKKLKSIPKSSGASRDLSDYSSELENMGGYTILDDFMKKHLRAMERQKPGYTNKWFKGHTKSPLERRKEPWEKMYGTPDNVFSNFRKPEIGDFEFKPMSEGWNAMQPIQLRLQGVKGPDIPDVSRAPWRKIDDIDINPQRISPEKYQEYGLDPEGFAFGKLKGERPLTDPNFLENLKAAKQRALDQGNDQMANMYDDLIKRKQKEALESFTEPYTAQKALKEINYNKEGGAIKYNIGDEVDEATMKELKKLGYTFEEI